MSMKYVTHGQADENIDHVNAWYGRCQTERVPYVTIRTRKKYADIQWDHINLPKEFDDIIRAKGEVFVKGFTAIFMKHANQKSSCRAGSFVVEFTDISIEQASRVAEEVYDYVFDELGLDGPRA